MYYKKSKRKVLSTFYKDEMVDIHKILIDEAIEDKVEKISELGNLKKLVKSLSDGYYTGIDDELSTIREWFNELNKDGRSLNKDGRSLNKNILKGNQYSDKQLDKSLYNLIYLNKLYENGLLNENTYYPIFKTINPSKINCIPSFDHLLNSKKIDLQNEEVKKAISNISKIEKEIQKYYNEINLKNLKYRRSIEEFLENNNYLENYQCAEYLVSTYTNNLQVYRVSDFAKYASIDTDRFEQCVAIVSFLNPKLYNEYLVKKENDSKKNLLACYYTFVNLANDITTYQKNGQDMPVLEFLFKAPFVKYVIDYDKKMRDFIDNPGISNIIQDYLNRNNLKVIYKVSIDKILEGLISKNDYVFTDEDRNRIKQIFGLLDLPNTPIAINIVIGNYVNGVYNLDNLKKEKNEALEKKLIKNPYTFISK